MVVLLEKPDEDEPVCEGCGVVGLAVESRISVVTGVANEASALAVVVVGVAAVEKNALRVKGVRPQPRKTVEPALKRYFPTLGVKSGL